MMHQPSSTHASWRTSTSMIFWGVLALTVFGCVASFCEFFFGFLATAKGYLDSMFDAAAMLGDQSSAEGFYKFYAVHSRLAVWTRAFEVLTIGGWIAYVAGLSKFREAQSAKKGLWLTGSLYTACWLGLVGMGLTFIGSFIGLFGLLFRFAGWVLNLISLFKFRGAFNGLSIEDSWDSMAQRGASNLRLSYTFGIILAFYPLIVLLTAMCICIGSLSNLASITDSFAADGLNALMSLIGGAIAVFILLALAAFVLWICQVCFLLGGWHKIKNGSLADDAEVEDEYPSGSSSVVALGAILVTVILVGTAAWSCVTPLTQTGGVYSFGKLDVEGEDDTVVYYAGEDDSAPEYTASEEKASSATEEPAGEEYTYSYQGTVNGKYGIEMTLSSDGGAYYTGEYFYTRNRQPIQLNGRLTDDYEHLVLEEYVGSDMTGKFEGTLSDKGYSGTWTSADGKKSYPFSVSRM